VIRFETCRELSNDSLYDLLEIYMFVVIIKSAVAVRTKALINVLRSSCKISAVFIGFQRKAECVDKFSERS
jgi:hypothetical protein